MKLKARIDERGAALVEYVIVLGLIGVMAIGSVWSLGGKVRESLQLATVSLSGAQETSSNPVSGGGGDAAEEKPVEPGPTFSWKGDGSDVLPAYATTTPDGWLLDLSSLVDPEEFVGRLRFKSMISQSGTLRRDPDSHPLALPSYTYYVYAYWVHDGGSESSMVTAMDNLNPEGDLFAYRQTPGAYVPNNVTGIRLERSFHCNSAAICTVDEFEFDIEFYTQP